MKINRDKLDLAKARACMRAEDIYKAGFPKGSYLNCLKPNANVEQATAGKLARILGVDVTEIIDM